MAENKANKTNSEVDAAVLNKIAEIECDITKLDLEKEDSKKINTIQSIEHNSIDKISSTNIDIKPALIKKVSIKSDIMQSMNQESAINLNVNDLDDDWEHVEKEEGEEK